MPTKPLKTVFCLVALAAYVLNMAAVVGGVVLCQEEYGSTSLEIAFNHVHCSDSVKGHLDHSAADNCWCSYCPCEDTPIGLSIALSSLLRHYDVQAQATDVLPIAVAVPFLTPQPSIADGYPLPDYADPIPDRTLTQLRSVILVI